DQRFRYPVHPRPRAARGPDITRVRRRWDGTTSLLQLPQAQRFVGSRGQGGPALAGERQAPDLLARTGAEGPQLLATLGIPDAHRPVGALVLAAAGDEFEAVRREGDTDDRVAVPFQVPQLLAAVGVPQPYRPVVAAGGDALAVRGNGHGVDLARVP